jgi:hypothetical protein
MKSLTLRRNGVRLRATPIRIQPICRRCGLPWSEHAELYDADGGAGYLCRLPVGTGAVEVVPAGEPAWMVALAGVAGVACGPVVWWSVEVLAGWLSRLRSW